MSVIFGVGVLLTGSIWAKASWGHWWVWDEPTLVSFLIVFLLYATYYPFRYAIEDPERQARYASVFAITAGAFVPLNFLAVRLAESLSTRASSRRPTAGFPADVADLPRLARRHGAPLGDAGEVRADRQERPAQLSRLRRALDAHSRRGERGSHRGSADARAVLPCARRSPREAGKYVAGAYVVFLVLILLRRDHGGEAAADRRELTELAGFAESAPSEQTRSARR